MSKDDVIEFEGIVVEALPNATFKVKLPNEHIIFDRKPMKILQVQEDMGMYTILLMANEPKAVAY